MDQPGDQKASKSENKIARKLELVNCQTLRIKFPSIKNKLSNEIRKSNRSYYNNKISKAKAPGSMFGTFNEIKANQKSMDIQIDVEEVNHFFVEVGQKLARQKELKQYTEQPKLRSESTPLHVFL